MTRKTSPARIAAFFRALEETGNQTIAAEAARVSRSWMSLHRFVPFQDTHLPAEVNVNFIQFLGPPRCHSVTDRKQGGTFMKTLALAAMAMGALLATSTAAQAQTTLTFSDINSTCYGVNAGCAMLPNMTQDATNLYYTSNGYTLAFSGGTSGHIGDGTGTLGTYNWHDGPANNTGSTVTLTRVGGGVFDLLNFDYFSNAGITATAAGYLPLVYAANASGTSGGFANVTSVTFYGPGGANQLDNIVVRDATGAVPEPATWAMIIGGFGMIGGALRRRGTAAVRFA